MKVLIYAYREWALNVAKKLCELEEINIDIKVGMITTRQLEAKIMILLF